MNREKSPENAMLNVALPKGRLGEKVYGLFAEAGFECPAILENSRKLIFENPEAGVRYFWVKPSDVAIYVARGAADIGVAGKDILLEYRPEVYELMDLGIESAISPKDITANSILSYVRALHNSRDKSKVESLSFLVGGKVEALEFRVIGNDDFLNVPFKELITTKGCLVASIVRGADIAVF